MRQSPRTVASDPEMADDVQQALTKALATGTPARVFRRGVASAAACEAAAKAVERATGTPCSVEIEHCFNITSTALGDDANEAGLSAEMALGGDVRAGGPKGLLSFMHGRGGPAAGLCVGLVFYGCTWSRKLVVRRVCSASSAPEGT